MLAWNSARLPGWHLSIFEPRLPCSCASGWRWSTRRPSRRCHRCGCASTCSARCACPSRVPRQCSSRRPSRPPLAAAAPTPPTRPTPPSRSIPAPSSMVARAGAACHCAKWSAWLASSCPACERPPREACGSLSCRSSPPPPRPGSQQPAPTTQRTGARGQMRWATPRRKRACFSSGCSQYGSCVHARDRRTRPADAGKREQTWRQPNYPVMGGPSRRVRHQVRANIQPPLLAVFIRCDD
mmetsp:Transcript_17766/g.45943  ORF Transcript_17766/g.45943 Transcript_17766/m.45943 type:complete len:240 (-) Transcript_17766:33-752(-)